MLEKYSRCLCLVVLWVSAAVALAQGTRFVIDDDEYVDRVTEAAAKLKAEGKLHAAESFRVQNQSFPLGLAPLSQKKLEGPDLYERLRESTLAVGNYYKCPECGEWHFNSSAGFVVGVNGVICTCCHVVTGKDEGVKESYLIAADSSGHVWPVTSVLAADTDADTCFLQIDAHALKPLPLRASVRPGERVYCLSHPGGYHYMFSQGMVARVNRRRDDILDDKGKPTGQMTRPVLLLNVTAEFAPGSSGAPVVDEAGNVVAQVASISDAGEPAGTDENAPASPSVPIRFCTAAEEILRLSSGAVASGTGKPSSRHEHKSKTEAKKLRGSAGEGEWLDIQPGADLKGWTRIAIPPTNNLGRAQWHVDTSQNVLVCDGDGGHEMLRWDRELGDCVFEVEFRFLPATGVKEKYNSGAFIRNSAEGRIWHQAQLTPDGGFLFGVTLTNGVAGRFQQPVTEHRMKPAGEWNSLELAAHARRLGVTLNGREVCAFERCEVPKGYVALESEGFHVEFRNVRVKILDTSER